MAKDKEQTPDGALEQGIVDPEQRDREKKGGGQFAGDNHGIKDDKSIGQDADHGQRGSQGGNKRGGSKG